jgi:hypothetical protein
MKATLIFENEIKFYKAVELVQNLVEDQTFDFNFGLSMDDKLYIGGNDNILCEDELNEIIDELILILMDNLIDVKEIKFSNDENFYM